MLAMAGLFILSFIALEQTIIKTAIVLLPGLLGGILGTAILTKLWIKHNLPFWIIFLYGMLSGASLPVFLLSATNYFLRDNKTFQKELDIVRIGNRSRQKSGCKPPYAIIVYKGIEKKVLFPCEYENSISSYKKVRLELSEGFLGFYVIQNEVLVP